MIRKTIFWTWTVGIIVVGVCLVVHGFRIGQPLDDDPPHPDMTLREAVILVGMLALLYLWGVSGRKKHS